MLLLMHSSSCLVMKLLMLFGGVLGFGIGMICSVAHENSWPHCLLHAALAAYAGGWLMLWWGRAWQQNLKASALEQANRAAATSAPAPSISKLPKS